MLLPHRDRDGKRSRSCVVSWPAGLVATASDFDDFAVRIIIETSSLLDSSFRRHRVSSSANIACIVNLEEFHHFPFYRIVSTNNFTTSLLFKGNTPHYTTMKLSLTIFLSGLTGSLAFSVLPAGVSLHQHAVKEDTVRKSNMCLYSTATTSTASDTTMEDSPLRPLAKEKLIATAKRLKAENGIFIAGKQGKRELESAVAELEKISEPPSSDDYMEDFLGDWTLLCTTATDKEGLDTSKLPAFLNTIRDSLTDNVNKYLTVQQRIRSENDDGVIDRVDHVLEYKPPAKLQEILDNLPEQLTSLNINPLHVSKSKLVLVHKADVVSESPLKVKLGLKTIVLNVAGTSTFLEPDGADVAGINIPLGEFLQTGSFETTYMDHELRVSRGKLGIVDQLRVFVRTDRMMKDKAFQEIKESDVELGEGVKSDMDVDEVIDPEFADDDSRPSDVESTTYESDVEVTAEASSDDVDDSIDPTFTDEEDPEPDEI
jgi:hypothetical protein